jgi:hypothetical protein
LKRCVCDKTDAFSYTGAGCETLSGPVDDEEATAKAKEFAKKLNMTLRKEKEASDARALAARLREETEKKTLKNGDVLNATKKQINTLKDKQHSAVDAIKDLERDLTTLNETAAAMAKRAQDEKNEKEAKMKLTEEEASKAKKKTFHGGKHEGDHEKAMQSRQWKRLRWQRRVLRRKVRLRPRLRREQQLPIRSMPQRVLRKRRVPAGSMPV